MNFYFWNVLKDLTYKKEYMSDIIEDTDSIFSEESDVFSEESVSSDISSDRFDGYASEYEFEQKEVICKLPFTPLKI